MPPGRGRILLDLSKAECEVWHASTVPSIEVWSGGGSVVWLRSKGKTELQNCGKSMNILMSVAVDGDRGSRLLDSCVHVSEKKQCLCYPPTDFL